MKLLQIVGGGEAAQPFATEAGVVSDAPHGGEYGREPVVRLRGHEADGGCVHLLEGDGLAVDGHHREGNRDQLLVQIHLLVPEHEVVSREGCAVAPPHPTAEGERDDLPIRTDFPGPGDVGNDLGPGVVPVEQFVVLGGAVAVGGVEGAREASPPGAAVFADLAERLDHERILAYALLHGRQLARLDQLRQSGGLLEALREQGGIGDDLGAFQLAHEVCPGLDGLPGDGAEQRRSARGQPRSTDRGAARSVESGSSSPGSGSLQRGLAPLRRGRSWGLPFPRVTCSRSTAAAIPPRRSRPGRSDSSS